MKQRINSISPIDGRYFDKVQVLSNFFSEKALIKYRLKIEIEYFISLSKLDIKEFKGWNRQNDKHLRKIYLEFNDSDALEIKKIETITNHDVKAVEYFLKKKFETLGYEKFSEFIHFGLTSQDINNTAIPLLIKDFLEFEIKDKNSDGYYQQISRLIDKIEEKSKKYKNISMLAKTHGQPASPTKLGKEFKVFSTRIREQIKLLKKIPHSAKFGGATGNFNAHHVAFPKIQWKKFANDFVSGLGLKLSYPTTQIEHYDNLAALFNNLSRINNIVIDFNQDMWLYISMDYFKQKIKKGEIGSSAMPHKVNPIDFENAEGNLGLSNAIFIHLADKLTISRLQRDLSDSTALRNIGSAFGYLEIAKNSMLKGLDKLEANEATITSDLVGRYELLAEALQSFLRLEGMKDGYDKVKELSRGQRMDKDTYLNAVDSLIKSEDHKKVLKELTPETYIGIASDLAKEE